MTLSKTEKETVMHKFQAGANDTGSAPVQIALLTTRINQLTGHCQKYVRDRHSRYGLIKLVGQRRKLLKFLKRTSPERYLKLLEELDLRK